jgi:putative quorum-sensing-regulated virulence factor
MPFGRYKGVELHALPPNYLDWLRTIELLEPLLGAVLEEVERRRVADDPEPVFALACPDPRLAEQLVDVGFRALAKQAHPDTGGSHDAFLQLQSVNAWLRSIVRSAAA